MNDQDIKTQILLDYQNADITIIDLSLRWGISYEHIWHIIEPEYPRRDKQLTQKA